MRYQDVIFRERAERGTTRGAEEVLARARDEATREMGADGSEGRVQVADRADLTVIDFHGLDESAIPAPRKRRAAVLAVAAAVLVVIGVVVVPDQKDSNLETEPGSLRRTPDAVPSPTPPDPMPQEVGPPPSVVDSLGYRWSRVAQDGAVVAGEGDEWWMNSVTLGGPGLVAVGSVGNDADADGAVWTSVDGMIWSRVPHDEAVFGGDGAYAMDTVLVGGSGLVAIGGNERGAAVFWTSVDGFTWKRVSSDGFRGGVVNDVIAGGPGFVAVGENEQSAVVWTSVDGLSWSRVPHDQEVFGLRLGYGNGMVGVTVGGPGLVAVGSDGLNSDAPTGRAHAVVWTSVDGLTWSRVLHDESVFGGTGDQGMFDVVVGGPGLLAVGEDDEGATVWTSVDGITWSRVPDDEAVFKAGYAITSAIATSEGLVAFGDGGAGWNALVWTSRDGITWSRVPDDEAVFGGVNVQSVTAGGPGLVAVGSGGVIVAELISTPED